MDKFFNQIITHATLTPIIKKKNVVVLTNYVVVHSLMKPPTRQKKNPIVLTMDGEF